MLSGVPGHRPAYVKMMAFDFLRLVEKETTPPGRPSCDDARTAKFLRVADRCAGVGLIVLNRNPGERRVHPSCARYLSTQVPPAREYAHLLCSG